MHTYRFSRYWTLILALTAGILALVCTLVVSLPWSEPKTPGWQIGAMALVVVPPTLYVTLLVFRRGHYSIVIRDHGIGQPAHGTFVEWSQVAKLRERKLLGRVDLLDHAGTRVLSLEYQLENLSDALARILTAITYHSQTGGVFQREDRTPTDAARLLVGAGFLAIAAVQFGSHFSLSVMHTAVGIALAARCENSTAVRRVSMDKTGVDVEYKRNHLRISWSEITRIELALRGTYLDVFIDHAGKRMPMRPAGTDPFALWIQLERARADAERSAARSGVPRSTA